MIDKNKIESISDEDILLFRTLFNVLDIFIKQLKEKYPNSSINDWKGYLVQRILLLTPSYQTFFNVLMTDKDYITANTILRMLADHLAITKLIYVDEKDDMRLFRHYLFLLDGSKTYLKITDAIKNNVHVNSARYTCKKEIELILNELNKLPFKDQNLTAYRRIVEKENTCNWRFIKWPDDVAKRYTYQDLYKKMDIDNNIHVYLCYSNQFVHGLSLCSIGTVATKDSVPLLFQTSVSFLLLHINYLLNLFQDDMVKNNFFIKMLETKLTREELNMFFKNAKL